MWRKELIRLGAQDIQRRGSCQANLTSYCGVLSLCSRSHGDPELLRIVGGMSRWKASRRLPHTSQALQQSPD
jgi:hypothetical protein